MPGQTPPLYGHGLVLLPSEPRFCYLFRNRALMGPAVIHDPARQIIRASLALGFAVERAAMPFAQALLRASNGAHGAASNAS